MTSLTPSQVQIIKSTVPVLAEHGTKITTRFYHDLLEAHPELKNVFNNTHQATGHQAQALAGSLYAYAANIDDLGNLSPALELICHKHASLFIRADHYAIVGKHLLETMQTVLGDAATPDILEAWGAAYWQLANIMIAKEDELYKETSYWPDWEDFTIAKKEKESEEITSFYLEPVKSSLKLPMFKPGQYVSVNIFVDELDGGVWQARQYSLSDAPGKNYLRISVKREPGIEIGEPKHMTHAGYISNLLHDVKKEGDVVQLSHPFGDFFFDAGEAGEETPVVLISAGVGLTALTSIFNFLIDQSPSRPITWIQGARNSKTRAFKHHIDQCVANHRNVHAVYYLSSPSEEDMQGRDYDIKGRVDLDRVGSKHLHTDNNSTLYYLCGPTSFMLDVEAKLKSYGVPSERVKMELFGTGGVPRI
ncbi:globin-like protein [Curvularia clavata]|uniref:nitric oxide dioxygenase n=1 Tax=Curvularia clavata TaxID=95742 RepID=A0A9Q9DX47_CURCL|nr:globin-like protein [Curvularia clavata]